MIGKSFYWQGIDLMHTESDFRIAVSDCQWRKIKTSDDKQDYMGYHGVKASSTFARGRSIVLEGYIIATNRQKVSLGMDRLRNLFSLQGIPDGLQLDTFKIIDEQDRSWNASCKVDIPIDFEIDPTDDHINGARRAWRVTLFAPDPFVYSDIESIFSQGEGVYGGASFPHILPNQWEEYYNQVSCLPTNNTQMPVKVTITAVGAINSPLYVYNITQDKLFQLNTNASPGDIIIIDGNTKTITKNGTNISALREPGSVRPSIKGATDIILYDIDGGVYVSDFNVDITFTNKML